ncbi:MAG: hypothetical protein ACI9SE_001651 [Neolewinella sp.]|jgi:hypothetical protein
MLCGAIGATILAVSIAGQAPGLRVFQQLGGATVAIDPQSNVVHTWAGGGNLTAHVSEDGSLLRGKQTNVLSVPGTTGAIQRFAFDGSLLWDYAMAGPSQYAHHDIEPMPNGNVLVIAWDGYTVADAIAQGRDPALISGTDWLPDAILEIQQTGPTTGTVVWEWHMMDHVIQDFDPGKPNYGVVANHPELLNLNYPTAQILDGDWNHFNGLDYDPQTDRIIVSSLHQIEIYLIDHSTTTAEAASHTGGQYGKGGDLLFRWGNPEAYGAGTIADRQLGGQHDPRFVPPGHPGAGHITMFNNGFTSSQSAAFEIALPLDAQGNIVLDPLTGRYGPVAPLWTYTDPSFYSPIMSSVERLPNGNTLIASATQGRLFEVTSAGQVVWDWLLPNAAWVFQCHYVDRSLWSDTAELSASSGGQIGFDHLVGSTRAGEWHLLLGSLSGTLPGAPGPGGITLPLNPDILTMSMASNFNNGMFVNTLGMLDAVGGGASSIVVNPGVIPAALVGVNMDFAHLTFNNTLVTLRASNPVRVTIVQ